MGKRFGTKSLPKIFIFPGGQAIFISGGGSTETPTEVLDIESSTCSRTTANLPDRRYSHTSHLLNNSMVICGGWYDTFSSCIVSSSPATGDWRNHSTMTGSRRYHSGTVVGDKIYLVAGGASGSSSQTTDYWDGERWEEGPRLPHDVWYGSCTVTTSPTTILVTGGRDGDNRVVELDIVTGQYRRMSDMTEEREGHGCTRIGNKVVVVGGWRDKTSEILDLDTETWSMAGNMTKERWAAQLVTVNGRVLVMGGEDVDGNRLDTVEELDMGRRTWRRLGVRMKRQRREFAATVINKNLVCP